MRQPLRPFAIIAQCIETHEPGLRPLINAAFIADDEKLRLGMERFNFRKPATYFRDWNGRKHNSRKAGWRASHARHRPHNEHSPSNKM
jgi:hypothetical protein